MDLEAAGGVVAAGLIAGAIEKPTGEAGEGVRTCTDCGAEVTGKFCSNCGQPAHVHRSLLHLVEEVLHGVLHFDARIWRTLPLLAFNPGKLTREWVQGRRTRYVSPLAMFLFTVFVMFFVISFTGGMEPKMTTDRAAEATQAAEARTGLERSRETLAELEAEQGPGRSEVAIRAMRATIATLESQLAEFEKSGTGGVAEGKRADGLAPGSWQASVRDLANSGELRMSDNWLSHKVEKKMQNPDLALYKLQQTTYKFSFLLIPLSIPFVALLFLWKRGFTLYDHGVFVLYSLTAMSILFLLVGLLGPLWSGFAFLGTLAIGFGVPVHMFAQLKGAYSLSWFSAAWRTVLLLFFSVWALTLFLITIIALGVTG